MNTNQHPESFAGFYTDRNFSFSHYFVGKSYQSFSKHFRGQKCLELGPATGYMTKRLVMDFESVTAVEGSPTLFERIPDFDNLTKVLCLFEDFAPSTRFDTIVCNHVLEHIEEPIRLLLDIAKWIEPGGLLIIGVPNAKSFHRLAAVKMGLLESEYSLNDRDRALGHYRVYDFDLLVKHVRQAGYRIIGRGGIFLKFLSNSQIESLLSPDIIDAYFEMGEEFHENSAEIYLVVEPE